MASTKIEDLHQCFSRSFGFAPGAMAQAPGRLEWIGNHTDYNGGDVLGVAVNRRIYAAAGWSGDGTCSIESPALGKLVRFSLRDPIRPITGDGAWANYSIGIVDALARKYPAIRNGICLSLESDLSVGSGLSSSAAVELATAQSLLALLGEAMEKADLARFCRAVENDFVGVPCGILDQGVSAFGEENSVVWIDCSTESFSVLPLPHPVSLWVVDSAEKHAFTDGSYKARFEECQEALRRVQLNFPETRHLSRISDEALEWIRRQPTEPWVKRARHVAEEHRRVLACVEAIPKGDLRAIGELFLLSHRSSSQWFENSTGRLDFIVERLAKIPGIYGARLTGGGFGGAVVALADPEIDSEALEPVERAFEDRFRARTTACRLSIASGSAEIKPANQSSSTSPEDPGTKCRQKIGIG